MGEEEESGGVQALRAWADEAVVRAQALPPRPDAVVGPSRAYDGSETERTPSDHQLTVLSTRDYDGALTLTTAFVSGGARDVVGSRWTARDGASVLLMADFHRHLRAGLSPAHAPRAARLWMLDPDRTDPGCLSDELRLDTGHPGLQHSATWTAFIHQGHPGRGKERV
ncbi:CHAT domain-containing protein [Streptomyces sp. Inha503]|uniref:CHAT domain-containing protein n=1 Tax=Streptomyces sp. Inha503 TaxID=3383314 RepID=UPI00399FC1F0